MRIEAIWVELEGEVAAGSASGWLTRFALPNPDQPLYIALETASMRRAILLPVGNTGIPSKDTWPEFRGLTVFSGTLSGKPFLGVRLEEAQDSEVFSALAEDIAPRVSRAPSPAVATTVLLGRLRQWQKFLAARATGLGPELQRALYAELYALRSLLLPVVGPSKAIGAWVGPARAHQDFQLDGFAVEVKATAAQSPPIVSISSARQLDDTGIADLFLYVLCIDERMGSAGVVAGSETLPAIVDAIRQALSADSLAAEVFEDKLLEAGYLSADSVRYNTRQFSVRDESAFGVQGTFPRIVDADLPLGIGEVSYRLSLAACDRFSVQPAAVRAALNAKRKGPS